MVIDPAGDTSSILSNVRKLNLKIGKVVLTHTHPEHIGAVSHVAEQTVASFAVHMTEADNLQYCDYSLLTGYDSTFKKPPSPDRPFFSDEFT